MWCGVISLFPQMLEGIRSYGMTRRAIQKKVLTLETWDLRQFAEDKHATVDDRPYGGGPGMVLKPEPLQRAIAFAKTQAPRPPRVIYVTPAGERFTQGMASDFAERQEPLLFVAGRYEGVDQRIIDMAVDTQISIGDYVLSGGELAVMVIIDAVTRWLPEVLGDEHSVETEAFSKANGGILDHPQYTRPREFEGRKVPHVLLTGDHQAIERWRKKHALGHTWRHRADLLKTYPFDKVSQALLMEFQQEDQAEQDQ